MKPFSYDNSRTLPSYQKYNSLVSDNKDFFSKVMSMGTHFTLFGKTNFGDPIDWLQ